MNHVLQCLVNHSEVSPQKVAFEGSYLNGTLISLTYSDVLKKVKCAAKQLTDLNVNCIALKLDNHLDWMIIDLAAMWADIVLIPVPTFFSDQQIHHVLSVTNADCLIGEWSEQYRQDHKPSTVMGTIPLYFKKASLSNSILPKTQKITFTSGSTGTPKGVCLSQQHIANVSSSLSEAIEAKVDKHLVMLPLSTLLENVTGIYVPIILGTTSMIMSGQSVGLGGSSRFDAEVFTKALIRYSPNSLVLTPELLRALIAVAEQVPTVKKSLTFVAVGGAKVAPRLMVQAQKIGLPVFEGYGLSESGSVVSLNVPSAMKVGSCGKALPHLDVKLSKEGEILVKGNIALGYLNQPFDHEWYPTGDLGTIDNDGFLYLSGRKKNQIITSYGRNISPEWVESEAKCYLPTITLIVIGEAQSKLTAIVISKDDPHQIIINIAKTNTLLPDYARLQQACIVSPEVAKNWFTNNGRPRREKIHEWFDSCSNRCECLPSILSIPQ
ncbi:AMP-binding protein [Vibrio sp.]|nr:AMP-binding protein [Vibrio sp.]